ncbi:hypothetical protein Sste5346_004750 [Sporothrix stenoceras]|uniref:C6 zinc finger domain containing protein n=1 Tax=Sporothrix stenoceras TaxID=5173 RepID=A0ABR3Z6V5_9PEZI
MLNYYKVQFASLMLTFHVHVNPWHMSLPMAFDVPCLMDGIVALGKRHRAHICQEAEDVDVLVLKDRALSSFRVSLHNTDTAALLATVLTLVTLEYTRTSYAHWGVHIAGAHRIMEAAGGVDIARNNAPLRSFLVMILWYDLITALVSRRPPVFDKEYLVSVMAWRSAHEWSLVGLNGFPDEIFDLIHDIACASAMARHSPIPRATAADLERRLWVAEMDANNPSSSSLFDCWRQAMLLYCARVFGTGAHNPFSHAPSSNMTSDGFDAPLTSMAEGILAIVASMDPTSAMQKQCLLPVVLAASELGPHSTTHRALRADVEGYCERWNHLVGLRMYLSALHFIRSVWVCRDHHVDDDDSRPVWWGTVVEQMERADGGASSGGSSALVQAPTKEWMFG